MRGVIRESVPVLWFGDSAAYRASPLRVVTVATNPSLREFPVGNRFQRFPQARWSASKPANPDLVAALDKYFLVQPLDWFNELKPVLEGFDASFVPGATNTALHIDVCTPLATDPTWSTLVRTYPETAEILATAGLRLWHDLVRYLRPNVILSSFASPYLDRFEFEWTSERMHVPGLVGPKKATWSRRLRLSPSDHEAIFVFGRTVNVPFGALSHAERRTVGAGVLGGLPRPTAPNFAHNSSSPPSGPPGAKPAPPPTAASGDTEFLVSTRQVKRALTLVLADPSRFAKRDVYLETNVSGWRLQVEKPGRPGSDHLATILRSADGALVRLRRGKKMAKKAQYASGFPSSYLVAAEWSPIGPHFLPFEPG